MNKIILMTMVFPFVLYRFALNQETFDVPDDSTIGKKYLIGFKINKLKDKSSVWYGKFIIVKIVEVKFDTVYIESDTSNSTFCSFINQGVIHTKPKLWINKKDIDMPIPYELMLIKNQKYPKKKYKNRIGENGDKLLLFQADTALKNSLKK